MGLPLVNMRIEICKMLKISFVFLNLFQLLTCASIAGLANDNQHFEVQKPVNKAVTFVLNPAAFRQKRQFNFGLTAVNAAVKTGRDQAEALAGAQAAGWGSQPGFGLSGTNANTNTFTQNVGGFDFSSANANANAFNQGFGQNGFGGSAANANAQSFESGGPLGSFGASAANSASQGFNVGPGGLSGSATFAGSQTYDLPGDREISISYSNGFGIGPDGRPTISRGNAISVS